MRKRVGSKKKRISRWIGRRKGEEWREEHGLVVGGGAVAEEDEVFVEGAGGGAGERSALARAITMGAPPSASATQPPAFCLV